MFRGILIATTVVLTLSLVFIAARWAQRNFVPSPIPMVIPKDAPIQTPGYYETMAEKALQGFAAISPERRQALIANLKDNLQPLDQSLARLRSSRIEFLCIGEQHMASTRRFVAERVVPVLAVDVLYLEVADDELPSLMQQIDTGEAFLFFMTEIGIGQETFMVPDTSALDPLVFQWFSPLTRTFGRYRSIIVFVERVGDHAPASSGKVITTARQRMTV